MNRTQQVAASILTLILCGLAVATSARKVVPRMSAEKSTANRAAEPQVVAAVEGMPVTPVANGTPGLALLVRANAKLPEAQALHHRSIRDRLNQAKIGATRERVEYFRQFAAPHGSVPVGQWHGAIELVTPIPTGVLVDVAVTVSYGSGEIDTATLMERYSVVNDLVRYVGSWAPKNRIRFIAGVSPWGSLDGGLMVLTPPLSGYRQVHG